VAEVAKSLDALVIGVVSKPFPFEGRKRSAEADAGIAALREVVDAQIVIPNERLLKVSDENTSLIEAFAMADEILLHGVQGITSLITTPGLINTDFADVNAVMREAGSAIMGVGESTGDSAALHAARKALSSPLLEAEIDGAQRILLNITGSSELGIIEVSQAAEEIAEVSHPDANIIFGTVIDDEMATNVRVTVIATGFDRWDSGMKKTSRSIFRPKDNEDDEGILGEILGGPDSDPPIFDFDDEDGLDVPDFLK
jgi:cell division protein FtsZ